MSQQTQTQFIKVESRPYQREILSDIIQAVESGITSVIVDSPTGSGKTFLGLEACRRLVSEVLPRIHGVRPDEIGVAWVAMRSNLLVATREINGQYLLDGQIPEENHQFCPNLHTVSMFQRDSKFMRKYKIRIAVIDEAHHDTTESMARVYGDIDPQYCIGLTATPFRMDQNRLGFQKVIKKAGYRYLIDDGYLAAFNHWSMPSDWSPEAVTKTYLENPKFWGSSVMFFLSMAECLEASLALTAGGIKNTVVHGGSDREQQIEDLETGAIDVIISMAILAEGFDFPALQSVFVRDSQSKGLVMQMAGRSLRKFTMPDGRPKVANIVQNSNAKYPFTRFARARDQYVRPNGVWRSVKPNENVDKHVELTLKSIVNMPELESQELLKKLSSSKKKKKNYWKG
jgi:superfamily II DNA or RNA helicase